MGFLTKLFATASANYSLAELAILAGSNGSRDSSSGVPVTQRSAMTYGPWYRGITLLGADTGKLPLVVYKRTGEGKERDKKHPAYRLLHGDPNDHDSPFHFIELITTHAIARGNGYAYIDRDSDASPLALLPLPPDSVTPIRRNGEVWYMLEVEGQNKPRKLPAEDVLHIRGYSDDGLAGVSVYSYAAESLGLGIGQRKYSSVFFRNSGRPAVVLEAPIKLTDAVKTTLLQGWDRLYSGLDNAHRTAILDAGLKANVLSFNAEESQLVESRQFSIREVALFLGLPAHKISDIARTSFSSLEQENADYLNSSLDPWLCRWEGECRKKLLTEQEKADDTHCVEFVRSDILRADLAGQTAYYSASLGGQPWQTVNEIRALQNLNPIDGGDELAAPLNMATPGGNPDTSAQPPKPDPAKPQPADATTQPIDLQASRASLRTALESSTLRITRRVGAAARKASCTPAKYMTWLGEMTDQNADAANNLGPLATLAGHLRGTLVAGETAGAGLLALLHAEYSAVADSATPSTLADAVELLAGQLEENVPTTYTITLLGE